MIRRNLIGLATLVAFGTALPMAVQAQTDYPTRPVKLIVPFPAGGTSDIMGRMIADELFKALKQPFVVENVGGAGGVIGTERAAKAAPDGYTLVLSGVGQNAVAHGLNSQLGYDSIKDFVHITQIHSGPNVLVAHPSAPFKTFKELIDYGKANPGKLNYGYTHAASGHMAMELLKQTVGTCTGTKGNQNCKGLFMVGIPYRGGGPMMTDLLGGQIPMMFINQDVALQHVKAGKLRALAVSSLSRNPLYPDVPTIAESGYPGFSALSWSGLSAPKGTPKVIVDKLEAAAVKAMQSPAIQARMESQGFVVPPLGAADYTQFVRKELDRWTRVIKIAGIKAE
ncbi:Bug family tripartite tricarboxylate transporter substrate binding protein [Polaromonas jejuensis]|uniref:Bug family tripartite tricarboxylate transporter substrate binding protein n=1 Tax=Polaromonas jejuensis TaxID=457502 RepID=A0ABW0QEF8_9BURK|nr:tripartite tricarboxylate transporter substrate binding protein [Polaromonas jejuensis]